jgi:hypothetical protein
LPYLNVRRETLLNYRWLVSERPDSDASNVPDTGTFYDAERVRYASLSSDLNHGERERRCMALSDIAAGLSTTTEQRERGVASVDATDRDLADALDAVADDLPCAADAAALVVDGYVGGAPVDAAGHDADVAPVTAAKTLHRLGFEGLAPTSATGDRVLEDYLAGRVSRADARGLLSIPDAEFALATYVATHDPIDGARAIVEGALENEQRASAAKRDAFAETMPDADEFA